MRRMAKDWGGWSLTCLLVGISSSTAFTGGPCPSFLGRTLLINAASIRTGAFKQHRGAVGCRMQEQESAKDVLSRAIAMEAGAAKSTADIAKEAAIAGRSYTDAIAASAAAPADIGAMSAPMSAGAAAEAATTLAPMSAAQPGANSWAPPDPTPNMPVEEVVKQLLTALKNNNNPTPNAGLRTVLRFSSPSNPITKREPDFFFSMMRNSQYSVLLGIFNTFQVMGVEDLSNTGAGLPGQQTVAVTAGISASTQSMLDAGVDFSFMEAGSTKGESMISLKWQLSKDAATGCWLSDTLFFVPAANKGKTMTELTSPDAVKQVRFTGTAASQKLKAQAAQTVERGEANAMVKAALSLGLLKPTSPLVSTAMVGNKGFDPLGFASSPDLLLQYREAELKHARLAMLAAAGWLGAETLHTPLANALGWDSLLSEGSNSAGIRVAEKVPSLLNGGLQQVQPTFWVAVVLLSGVVEAWRMLTIAENPMNFTPGAIGFDPLKLYAKHDAKGQRALLTKEINNGRLAMLAVAYFALAEKFADSAIINSVPLLPKTGNLLEEVVEELVESILLLN